MNPQEVVELLRRTGCVIAVVSVSVAKAQEIQTLPSVVVIGRFANLVGVADSATEGTISARQLATRPLLRPAEVLESVPGLTHQPGHRRAGCGPALPAHLGLVDRGDLVWRGRLQHRQGIDPGDRARRLRVLAHRLLADRHDVPDLGLGLEQPQTTAPCICAAGSIATLT